MGAALFRQAGRRIAKQRRLSSATEDGSLQAADTAPDGVSHASVDSGASQAPPTCGCSGQFSHNLVC